MTLLTTCINRLGFKLQAQSASVYSMIMVLLLVLLQGCSNTSENEHGSEKQTPESLSKELTDLVDVFTENAQLSTDENAMLAASQSKRNRYLEQKQARLATVPAHVIAKYQQALTLMTNKEWLKAELLFDQVLKAQPQLSGAYVNKALIAIQQKDFSRANQQLKEALAVNPINPYAYEIKGRLARLSGHFEQAEKSYLKALEIWPEYPEAQVNLAILLELYRGRLLDAHKYYSSYLALQTDDQQVQRWLAGVEIKIKRAGLVLPEKPDNNLSSSAQHTKSGEG
ncbi:MAG: tetratricopeptide repeat protein [Colwellia sp.]|nr:tetratricopeptide repeat protein [Colwellia sp.]